MPQTAALLHELRKKSTKNIFLQGLLASSTPLFFSGLRKKAISGKLSSGGEVWPARCCQRDTKDGGDGFAFATRDSLLTSIYCHLS